LNTQQFFDLFEKEISTHEHSDSYSIKDYYKFVGKGIRNYWRKIYLRQRLEFIDSQILSNSDKNISVWDVGCGFGTSSLFLAMNNIKSTGLTLEGFHKIIPKRKKYWQSFGNTDFFKVEIQNLFETSYEDQSFDYILVQDTLHHLEPIDQAVQIFRRALKNNGKIIIVDENGNNIPQRIKLYLRRGNKRIIKYFDENLKKEILLGNENIRSLKLWNEIFSNNGMQISDIEYIRFFPPLPGIMNSKNGDKLENMEHKIWRKSKFLREYFYWGLSFTANKV
jgi:SAM-dependent methyltransferase